MIDRLFGRYSATGTQMCCAVVVDPAGVVDGALAELEIGDEVAFHVDLEQMADALAGVAIVAVDGLATGGGSAP